MQNLFYSSLILLLLLVTSCSEDFNSESEVDLISEQQDETLNLTKSSNVMSVEKLEQVDLYLPDLTDEAREKNYKNGTTQVIFQSSYHIEQGRAIELKGRVSNLPKPF